MLKTKKKFLLIALLSAIAMLCCGMALLFTLTSVANPTSTNLTVKAMLFDEGYDTTWNETPNYYSENSKYYADAQGVVYGYFSDYDNSHECYVVGYTSTVSNNVVIPETIHGYTVYRMDECVFEDCTRLHTLTLDLVFDDNALCFQERSFYGCSNLEWVWVRGDTTHVIICGDDAFEGVKSGFILYVDPSLIGSVQDEEGYSY